MFKLAKIQGDKIRKTLNEMRDTERVRRLLGLTEESFNRKLDGEDDISQNEADILYDFLGGNINTNLGFLKSFDFVPFSTGVGTYERRSQEDKLAKIDIEPFSRKTLEVKLGFNPEKASLERSLLYAFLETRTRLDAKKIRALVKKSEFYSALELDKSSKFFKYEEKNIKGLVKYLIKSN